MSYNDDGRHFLNEQKDEHSLKRSKQLQFDDLKADKEELKRHQASDEQKEWSNKFKDFWTTKKNNKQEESNLTTNTDQPLSRVTQKKKQILVDNEMKAQALGHKLNRVILILLILIILVYLFMRFVNF